MVDDSHSTYVYVGLGGEGENIGLGGMYRRADGDQEWQAINNGLPNEPQVRALVVHPQNPQTIYAGTQNGVYRSDDRQRHGARFVERRGGCRAFC